MLFKLTRKTIANLPRLALLGVGSGVVWSKWFVDHDVPTEPSLPGQSLAVGDASDRHVQVYSDESGTGRPVLLVHSVNAAASAFEMEPLYERLRGERPVWALDLPGFGGSDRSDRAYSPQLMASAIISTLERIGEPTDVVALSLGAEFAARAAIDRPDLFTSLALISPTGFGPERREMPARLGTVLRLPLVDQALYDAVVSTPSIRFFLSKSMAGAVDERMVERSFRTAHQPGAKHAPLAFLAGELFTPDAHDLLYSKLEVPTVVLYDEDPFTGFVRLPEVVNDTSKIRPVRIPGTKGLPHWDQPIETLDRLREHWSRTS